MERFLKASSTPIADIERVAYKGQPDKMRLYHSGFERFMDEMPVLNTDDEFLDEKVKVSREIMQKMAHEVGLDRWVQRLPIMCWNSAAAFWFDCLSPTFCSRLLATD